MSVEIGSSFFTCLVLRFYRWCAVDPDMDSTARVGDDRWKGALQLRDRSYVAIKLPVGEGTAAMAGAFTIESWFRLTVSVTVVGFCPHTE